MQKGFLLLFIFLFHIVSYAQIIQKEDGLYYNENNKAYSGTYIEFHPNGVKRIEVNLLDGKKEGITLLYSDDNQLLEERSFTKNEKDGTWKTFNKQGVKVAEANYSQGEKDGKWYIWNDEGILLYDMTYAKGKKTGTWIMYDEQGNIQSSKKY